MAGPTSSDAPASTTSLFGPGVPALPEGATNEQKDQHWFQHVYQGDKMPQLTFRAVLTGGILGMLMAAANLYTTLAIGWAFGVAITASVMSFIIWTGITGVFGGRKMSILETNCMASTASAAGYSTGSTIATMFGALILMETGDSKLIETAKVHPAWLIALFTLCTGLMGVFLAIPMKRQMINHEQLPFPSGIAAAETLRSLYSESKEAAQKAYTLVVGLLVGVLVGTINTGRDTLKILDKFYDTTRLELAAQYPEKGFFQVNNKSLIGFGFEPSVLLIAAGMIVGMRVSLSMLAGSLILYLWVGPQLIAMDVANAGKAGYVDSIELVAGGTIYHLFRWGLWGGTALMVCSSLTALAMQWKTVGRAMMSIFQKKENAGGDLEARMAAIEVPFYWMIVGMVPITIAMVFVQHYAFEIAWWAGIIAVAMSFVLSLVACRATGETDTTPIGAMGKVMQLLYAVLSPGSVKANLASAGIAANSASSSADLLTDLKIGYLLGANPRRQFLAQFVGCFFGTIAIVPIWFLMVPTKAALEKFPAPATNQWYRVAQVLVKGINSLPESAKYAIVIGAILGVALPLIEKVFVPAKHRKYFPSVMGIGLSWVLPFANAFAFCIGAAIAWAWSKLGKSSCEKFNIPLASGLVAGESLIKAILAMLATASGIFAWNL
jgi:OPT family oligopeptide transporter